MTDGVTDLLLTANLPGLPPLPSEPRHRHDRPEWREAWREWHDAAIKLRLDLIRRAEHDREVQQHLIKIVAADPAMFCLLFGWTFEPRDRPGRPAGPVPFIPYPFQIRYLRTRQWALKQPPGQGGDIVVSKARDMGMSWATICFHLWGWLFLNPFSSLLISYKEELVEHKSMKSLFTKLDFMRTRLPLYMIPEGFNETTNRVERALLNPTNHNIITGETTTTLAGRGDRVTVADCDEAAFYREFLAIWGSLRASTDHRGGISTESVEAGDAWVNLRMNRQGGTTVMEFDWWLHPDHDEEWYARERARAEEDNDLAGFAREVERNAFAGFGEWVYPEAQNFDVGDYPYEHGDPIYVSIDPGKDDETVIHWISLNTKTGRYRIVESYYNKGKPAEFYACILTGIPDADRETGFGFTEDEESLMAWTRTLPMPLCYGDPYGDSTFAAPNEGPHKEYSFYDRIRYKSRELILRAWNVERPIIIQKGWKREQRTYQGRRLATQRVLPRTDFNDTPAVRRTLSAFKSYRFQPMNKDRYTEQSVPIHSWASHYVTSYEYWAVNMDNRGRLSNLAKFEPGPRATLGSSRKKAG